MFRLIKLKKLHHRRISQRKRTSKATTNVVNQRHAVELMLTVEQMSLQSSKFKMTVIQPKNLLICIKVRYRMIVRNRYWITLLQSFTTTVQDTKTISNQKEIQVITSTKINKARIILKITNLQALRRPVSSLSRRLVFKNYLTLIKQ